MKKLELSRMSARNFALFVCVVIVLGLATFVSLHQVASVNANAPSSTSSTESSPNIGTTSIGTTATGSGPAQTITSSSTSTDSGNFGQMQIAMPLYTESMISWNVVFNASGATGIVILNPDYGPGNAFDSNYSLIVQRAQQSGEHVLGYVYTNYADGSIPVSEVEQWISDWYNWYHVDGIFFDEVQSYCTNASIAYYTALYNYTKSQIGSDIVVLNPGNPIGQCYAPISDILVTFEGNYAQYVSNYTASAWTRDYPPSHFWHIVYNATTLAETQEVISLAGQRGAGWIYVSDGLARGVNALGRLPQFYCQEVQMLAPDDACQIPANATA
jgi:hypothetical protein